ncbi:uncharacterized protein EDB91DRAFT_1167330 [Suillus paluster]|uniref:uncharacterized protein n=1 Tax=Suillus paluster TaxID=48578 RepID=UPI001B86CE4B|nr:uncharacterized protein EDB91DRAFT_1167330 [Suillus paluster]KAG1725805.1 hypothetical protein EDB91DRAFT_1167330 [Suillus paluster]
MTHTCTHSPPHCITLSTPATTWDAWASTRLHPTVADSITDRSLKIIFGALGTLYSISFIHVIPGTTFVLSCVLALSPLWYLVICSRILLGLFVHLLRRFVHLAVQRVCSDACTLALIPPFTFRRCYNTRIFGPYDAYTLVFVMEPRHPCAGSNEGHSHCSG